MSVKSKVKRCNKEINRLQEELETYQLSNNRLREKLNSKANSETLENTKSRNDDRCFSNRQNERCKTNN